MNKEQLKEPKRGSLLPPKSWIMMALLSAIAIYAAVYFQTQIEDAVPYFDRALRTIIGGVLVIFLTLWLVLWFVFFSGYSSGVRYGLTIFGLIITFAFFGLVEYRNGYGSFWPPKLENFHFRFAKKSFENLDALEVKAVEEGVNLKTGNRISNFSQFGGPSRNFTLNRISLAKNWDETPPVEKWRIKVGAGWSGFAAVNQYVVTLEQRGEDEVVTCYDLLDGKPVWSHTEEDVHHSSILGGHGPQSTPTIDPQTGFVYTLGGTGILLCLDGKDGSVKWRKEILAEVGTTYDKDKKILAWGRSASPLLVDGKVVVPGGGIPSSDDFATLLAFDMKTGEKVWGAGKNQISYSSPIRIPMKKFGQQSDIDFIVYVGESKVSWHYAKTGKVYAEYERPGSSSNDANCSQPIPLPGSRMLFTKGYGLGAELVTVERVLDNPDEDGINFRLNIESQWKKSRSLKTKFTNVVVLGEQAYGLSDEILECIDVADGTRRWRRGRYGHGQILLVGKEILVLSEQGYLALVSYTPNQATQLTSTGTLLTGTTWNTICLQQYKGKAYAVIRNSEEAVCLEMPTLAVAAEPGTRQGRP